MRVWATREGLEGQETSSGWLIRDSIPFVALPSYAALHWTVKVTNPANGKSIEAIVLDVGPHSDHDDAYVLRGTRPAAEFGISVVDKRQTLSSNKAGIDLGQVVWKALGMTDNADVEWEKL